jgi:hypothetical protein
MRRIISFGFSGLAWALAQSALAVPEVEPNDDFADRQILAPGDTTLEGGLADVFASSDEMRDGVLAAGAVDSWTFTGATPGAPFTAWIDNFIFDPGPDFDPDTVLGEFDVAGNLVDSNDDASPVGDGLASALAGSVNSDGSIRLKVSGWPDFDFDGQDDFSLLDPHPESGSYTLFVTIGETPDVDYVTFTGLTPGAAFDAEIVNAEFDTVMGRFDDAGALIDFNDDQGLGFSLSRLMGDVPPNGQIHLAIGGFEDLDLNGRIEDEFFEFGAYEVGSYDLVLQVPEPGKAWLLGAALSGAVGLARRRGRGILPAPPREESP